MTEAKRTLGLTDFEYELVLLIWRGVIQRRIYKMLQPISIDRFRGSRIYKDYITVPQHISINCPHCGALNSMSLTPTGYDASLDLFSALLGCSDCEKKSKLLLFNPEVTHSSNGNRYVQKWKNAWVTPPPKDTSINLPDVVGAEFKQNFTEAALTLQVSHKASACLSRYMLQQILEEKAGANHADPLHIQIQKVINANTLPSEILGNLEAVRHIGNFGAHPNKDLTTKETINISFEEAELVLEVVRELLDYYFIRPAKSKEIKEKFNQKMLAAGKNPKHLIPTEAQTP